MRRLWSFVATAFTVIYIVGFVTIWTVASLQMHRCVSPEYVEQYAKGLFYLWTH